MRRKLGNKQSVSKNAQVVEVSSGVGETFAFIPLDKNSFIPLYAQIQSQLLDAIRSGSLKPGDMLPSAVEISRSCVVSRVTATQALGELRKNGYASSARRGGASFVLPPKVEKDIAHLSGFTAEMQSLGIKTRTRVLAAETVKASAQVAAQLMLEPGMLAFHLRRLRFAENEPVAIEETWLPLASLPGIERIDFTRSSLYQTLRENYGIRMSLADETLEARPATQQEAELLKVPARSSLLVISRTLWSKDQTPIEFAHSIYRGDRYRAVLRIPATTIV